MDVHKITLVAVDNHPLALAGLEKILEEYAPDVEVIGFGENGNDAIELVKNLHPNVFVLGVHMPGFRAWEITLWVVQEYPEIAVLALGRNDSDYHLFQMMDAGARGYLEKNLRADILIQKIREVAGGKKVFQDEQIQRAECWERSFGSKWQSLTERERDVLLLLQKGLRNLEIAEHLAIEERTVIFHVSNILKKLDVKTRHQAGLWMAGYLDSTKDDAAI